MLFAPEITPTAYTPPQRRLLGPGPSDISTRVLQALAKPTIGYLDPSFVDMMEQLKALLRYAFQTKNKLTFPVSGPGSAGMEMCFVNLVSPNDKVIV
ncbi:MAG: hypothetical protein KDI00_05545, partial [Pseudomonadales bacterium]|nr:hypothetical protein [Pseudomonadales bacterium]